MSQPDRVDGAAHERATRAVPLLAGVAEDDVRALAEAGRARSYRAGETIFAEGDPGDALYTIIRGSVRVTVVSPGGRETTLATLRDGDSVGELALLDGRPRSASAVAALPTTTLVIARDDFRRWLADRPLAAQAILETLSLRLRRTNETVADLTSLDVPQRIAKRLLQLLAEASDGSAAGSPLLRITQAELAAMVGSSREAVNKHLGEFQKAGWVALSRGTVAVEDADALRRVV